MFAQPFVTPGEEGKYVGIVVGGPFYSIFLAT